MTFEIAFLFLLLAVMVWFFMTERLPVELTAFAGLVVLVATGLVDSSKAFEGFASPAVITMFSVFFVSAALHQTGVAELVGTRVHKLAGGSETRLVVALISVSAVLSSFMNNVAATAVLMPVASSLARRAGVAPSRLFMPLAYGSILGGTTTLVGTPPNLLTTDVFRKQGAEPFGLFDFAPIGLVLVAVGVTYMLTIGRRLLPTRTPRTADAGADLARIYRLQERLFSVHVPDGGVLDGLTLREARFGPALDVHVASVIRDGHDLPAPGPDERIRGGDVLLVEGRFAALHDMLEDQGVAVDADALGRLGGEGSDGVVGARIRVRDGSSLAGRTLAELGFRDRYGVVVASIRRGDEERRDWLARERLEPRDELLVVGPEAQVRALVASDDFKAVAEGVAPVRDLAANLFLVRVPDGAVIAGSTLEACRIGELVGLTVVGIVREGTAAIAVGSDETIEAGDQLLISGEPTRVLGLLQLGEVEAMQDRPAERLQSVEIGVAEAVIAPRSEVAGKTLTEISFRERYGLQVLALWRDGRPIRSGLGARTLQFGDALLVQGPWTKIDLLASDPDFLVLGSSEGASRRTHKAPFAIGALLLMVVLVVTGLFPIQFAAFAAATAVVLCGALSMQEAYRAIEWRALFLVAAILPVGVAMETTHASVFIADAVSDLAGSFGPRGTLILLMLIASALSQGLDGAPTVVLLGPVVFHIADNLHLSPRPLMMGVALAASAAFMTPFSHKSNLLVMGPGGYLPKDYLRVGTPLTVICFIVLAITVPIFFPF